MSVKSLADAIDAATPPPCESPRCPYTTLCSTRMCCPEFVGYLAGTHYRGKWEFPTRRTFEKAMPVTPQCAREPAPIPNGEWESRRLCAIGGQ